MAHSPKERNVHTVLRSQCRTTAVRAHKSPESHQTVEKTGTYGLEWGKKDNSIWFITKTDCLCMQVTTTHTSSPLPQSPEPFLFHDLPETIDDSCVSGLARPRCNLQTRLDDISRCHKGGCRNTW